MRTAIFMTATLAAHASRGPSALWNVLVSKPGSRRNILPEAEQAKDDRSGDQPDGLEAFDFLRGWKGRE